jgi:L-alanine-DL-glutamate epimerase-like enolase superfamily enzyme
VKISNVEAIMLEAPIETPYKIATAVINSFYATVVRITTDCGIVGIGECIVRSSPRATAAIVEDMLAPVLRGRDPRDIEGLFNDMHAIMRARGHSRGFMIEAIAGVDMALWDIAARSQNVSIAKAMGGCARTKVPCYASSIMIRDVDMMEKEAYEVAEQGFNSIKVKVGLGDIREDIKLLRRIRRAVGEDINLSVDANSCYSAADAVDVGRRFEEMGVIWFEEPVLAEDISGYRRVRNALRMPIAAGESEFTAQGVRDFFVHDIIDIIQPDVARAGGYTGCRKIANLAEAFNKAYTPHTGLSSAICLFASLHLASYAVNFLSYEFVLMKNPLQHILNRPIPQMKGGFVEVPEGPGLGAELDEKAVAKYRI